MPKIMLIEDDVAIADTLIFALQREGYTTAHFNLGQAALRALTAHAVDLIILDVGLPDISGFNLCQKIRQHSFVPILFLTAHADTLEREMGLELGADDYVTKPFSLKEVILRVQALLRRTQPSTPAPPSLFCHDKDRKQIVYCQRALMLTRAEYLLLAVLVTHPDRVFSREQLLHHLPNSDDSGDRVIDTLIKQIRAKLREVDANHEAIITHRGLGYSACVIKP